MFPVPFLNRGIFVDPDASAYFDAVAATGTALTAAQKDLINPFYVGVKADGVYTKIDGGNILCLTAAAQCYIDFKVPSRVATVYSVPTWTFTTKRGFTGSGSVDTTNLPDSIDTGFVPSTAGGNMTQDSAFFAVFNHVTSLNTRTSFGANSTHDAYITPRSTGDVTVARINSQTNDNYLTSVTDASGFFIVSRTGAASSFAMRNGVAGSEITRASTGLPAASIRYLQTAGNTGSFQQQSLGMYGGGLSSAEATLLDARAQTLIAGLRAL